MCPTAGAEPNPFAFVILLLCVIIIVFFCIVLVAVHAVFDYMWPVTDAGVVDSSKKGAWAVQDSNLRGTKTSVS